MGIILFLGIVVLIAFSLSRWESHRVIKEKGGIRLKFNQIFSFFYNLPNSSISIETKSFVIFIIKDNRCKKIIKLNYYMDSLKITCKITYYDDTAFANGEKYEWSIWNIDNQQKVFDQIRETFASLP